MPQRKYNNKSLANIILGAVFVLFICAVLLKHLYRGSFAAGLLAYTAEAALVGGIADWFAVTALYKKPLGFSWHTAIIPSNREKIIKSVSELVSNELISKEALLGKISSLNITDTLTSTLTGSLDKLLLETDFQNMLADKTYGLDRMKLAAELDHFIREGLQQDSFTDELRTLLVNAFKEGKHNTWISALLGKAADIAKEDSTRQSIYRLLREQEDNSLSSDRTGSFWVKMLLMMSRKSGHNNLLHIAELLQQELVRVLDEIRDPGHPVFIRMTEHATDLLEHLDEDRTLLDLLQKWKGGVLERLDLVEALQQLLAAIIDSDLRRQEAFRWLADNLEKYLDRLKNDNAIKKSTEEMLKTLLEKVILREHHIIHEIAEETLDAFSDEKLIDFVNDRVGEDLQWIRINGSIVGAAAGVVIYLFTNLLYTPVLLPMIQSLPGLPG